MKFSNLLQYTVAAAISVGLISGCASTPTPEPKAQLEAETVLAAQTIDTSAAERAEAEARVREQARLERQRVATAKAEARAKAKAKTEAARRAEIAAARMTYSVVRGDSLWKISGRPEVYADPYRWPLIYKRNSDQIKDADLIYPGQVFAINRSPTTAEIDAAVHHARTRGAWSLGVVEESDRIYLSR